MERLPGSNFTVAAWVVARGDAGAISLLRERISPQQAGLRTYWPVLHGENGQRPGLQVAGLSDTPEVPVTRDERGLSWREAFPPGLAHYVMQSSDPARWEAFFRAFPEALYDVMSLNGHDPLMQVVFYHGLEALDAFVAMAERIDPDYLLKVDLSRTTVRGLGNAEMARQFSKDDVASRVEELRARRYPPREGVQEPYNRAAFQQDRLASYARALRAVAPPAGPDRARDTANELIGYVLAQLANPESAVSGEGLTPAVQAEIAGLIGRLNEASDRGVNTLGGTPVDQILDRLPGQTNEAYEAQLRAHVLQQPVLTVLMTGNYRLPNDTPELTQARATLRRELTRILLEAGADPRTLEGPPMSVSSVIRALVFGLEEVRTMLEATRPDGSPVFTEEEKAAILNTIPEVNGLTGIFDLVMRGSTATDDDFPRYGELIDYVVAHGADMLIEDFAGRSPIDIPVTGAASTDQETARRASRVLERIIQAYTTRLETHPGDPVALRVLDQLGASRPATGEERPPVIGDAEPVSKRKPAAWLEGYHFDYDRICFEHAVLLGCRLTPLRE